MEIPEYILKIEEKIIDSGFESFFVGGCIRDLVLGKVPKDWDLTTNARPDQILAIFEDGRYENIFGTVVIPADPGNGERQEMVEVTTYRSEQGYSDRRRPDEIKFEDSLDKDLERRDFTVNSLALCFKCKELPEELEKYAQKFNGYKIIDLFGGLKDIKKGIIRAVGEPEERFKEDALRMMRAIRFSCQLGFELEEKTMRAMVRLSGSIKFVSAERIRDELIKILQSAKPYEGIMALHESKMLQYILPELERGVGVPQNKHHIYTVFKHGVLSLKHCPSKDWRVRISALLHDIAKPMTKRIIDGEATFHNHDMVGAKTAAKIADRLKFTKKDADKIVNLVRYHMFYYNVGEVTESSVRRLIAKVGTENLKDLIDLRIADRLGSGTPKGKPYKLRHLEYMMKKVQSDPVSVKMLKINGDRIMELHSVAPGPKIGAILDALLSEVIEDPNLNREEYLEKRALELFNESPEQTRDRAKAKIEQKKIDEDKIMKSEFYV